MRHTLSLLLVVLTIQFQAQSQTIEGEWSLDIDRSVRLMEGTQKTNFENISAEKRNEIKQNFSQRTFRFLENGDFEVQWFDGKNSHRASGKWSVTGQRLTLTVNSKDSLYAVRELNTNQLVLEKEDGREGLFKILAFNR